MQAECSRLTDELLIRSIVRALGRRPDWTLGELSQCIAEEDTFGQLLGRVTIGDLRGIPPNRPEPRMTWPASLEQIDRAVFSIILAAWPRWVGAAHVRKFVEAPRWVLQSSFGRLIDAGAIERRGTTSATRYRAKRGPS